MVITFHYYALCKSIVAANNNNALTPLKFRVARPKREVYEQASNFRSHRTVQADSQRSVKLNA
ncbi:hypothetical protein HW555_008549 [Spodoptera exigua]|uniref:Uncharacterized protein n=1 Tax=Spodoptera exigua TaxID=7107 RepID=A0A835GCB5_SPOEX|nr:hypothetical protein HW555_008549 [Spodoptera exigua]